MIHADHSALLLKNMLLQFCHTGCSSVILDTDESDDDSKQITANSSKENEEHCCCGEELDRFCCSVSFIHKCLLYLILFLI